MATDEREQLRDAIDEAEASLRAVIADVAQLDADLKQLGDVATRPRLSANAPHVPIIVVNNDKASISIAEGMEMGAADVVTDSEPKHLVLVVKRDGRWQIRAADRELLLAELGSVDRGENRLRVEVH